MVRYRVTGAADDGAVRELCPVRGIGREDPVIAVEQDVRLGQAVDQRDQQGRSFGSVFTGHDDGSAGESAIMPVWQT